MDTLTGDILIVDDQPANLQLLQRLLADQGHHVRAARSGPRALAAVAAARPDLILLDIMMPEMDGYAVCRQLQADPRTRDIPVLFLSALSDADDKLLGFAAGAVDYITKPFHAGEVLARVRTHLALRALQRELATVNRELGRQLADLQARNEELDAFAHTVAHDLMNPLSRVLSSAELLQSDYADLSEAERHELLGLIVRGAASMERITDELLLLAGVRRADVAPEPLDMAAIVAEAQQRLGDLIAEHGATIVAPPAGDWPVALGHAPWLVEVWVNYLSNGCKYGGRPPRLELGGEVLASPDGGPGTARFWVRDNGDGLTEAEQARLFTPFTRLAQVRARGHGLGLSIVRRIVEKLSGRAGVESAGAPGSGSTFYFTLPLDPAAAALTTEAQRTQRTLG
jgi:signal transduction histidine kinase